MIGLGLGLTTLRGGGFNPAALFAASEPGLWLDPFDLSTLFQDTAGTQPVTAAGQSVARVNDKSGRGNHVTQATAASRPIYGVEPRGGRRNLLTYSGFDGAVSGTPGTAPTGWPFNSSNGSIVSLSGDVISFSVTAGRQIIGQTISIPATGVTTLSVTVGSNPDLLPFNQLFALINLPVGATTVSKANGAVVTFTTYVPVANDRLEIVATSGGTAGTSTFRIGVGASGVVTGSASFSKPQFELGPTATNHQRVVSQYEVTEAGVQSLPYLAFDGVDDWLVSPTITPGIDKVQVFAGVRKLSDATAFPMIAEFSANIGSNNGAFAITANAAADSGRYEFYSKGTTQAVAQSPAGSFQSPITSVISGVGDISGDRSTLRVNGAQVTQNTVDQGTGNFLAYPLYIGRRGTAALPFNGRIYGLITRFGANLTADQITATEAWMNQRTGAY